MANIKNYISLTDHMSPVFRSIIKSMDSTLRVMKAVDQQSNKGATGRAYRRAQKDIQRANNALIKMENQMRMVNKEADRTKSIFSKMGATQISPFNLTNMASGLYLIKSAVQALSGMMEAPDTARAVQYRLDTYDTSTATGGQLYDAAYRTAMDSRSDVDSTASLASRILVSGATGGSGAQAIKMAGILNKASFLGGSSNEESKRALLQLSQGLASGTLQGDELRAIREQSPGLTDVLARGLSKLAEKGELPEKFIGTTMGDLKDLGGEGELTSARIMAAFSEMEEYVNETFEDSPKLFGQAMTGVANVWKRWAKLMGENDNAFAKITDKAWQLLEWFQSSDGEDFMEGLARGVNFVVNAIFGLIDGINWVINAFMNMESSSNILKGVLFGLAAAFAVTGAIAFISWLQATWPILLVIATVALLMYTLYELGLTTGQIIGGICGAFMFLAYLIYDAIVWIVVAVYWAIAIIWGIVVWLVGLILQIVVGLGMAIGFVIQGIVQLILWAITTIIAIIQMVYNVIYTVIKGASGIIKAAIVGIYGLFVGLGEGVLGILYAIASAIDWVFGSNLSDTVGGWMKGLGQSVEDLNNALDPLGDFEDIGGQWSTSFGELGDMYAGNGKYDDWNITDNMGDLWTGGTGLIGDIQSGANSMMLDPMALDQWGLDNTINPMDGWNSGFDFGVGIGDSLDKGLGDLSMSMSDLSDVYGDGVTVDGGNLDSVGSIKSDVDISDEDIKLLRDIAARDFLLNLKTVTPQANVKFGDVRETADVNKILDVIEDMVEEQLATSLVME